MSPSTCVVGGGIAGIAAAARLAMIDMKVSLFDRGRNLGGRCSTRRVEDIAVNYGCQYVSVYPAEDSRQPSPGRQGTRVLEGESRMKALSFLGRESTSGMERVVVESPASVGALLSPHKDVKVYSSCNVVGLTRTPQRTWEVMYEDTRSGVASRATSTFDTVILADFTAAMTLTRNLDLAPEASHMITKLHEVKYRPIFSYIVRVSGLDGMDDASHPSFARLARQDASEYWVGFTSKDTTARLLEKFPMTDAHGNVVPQTKDYRESIAAELHRDAADALGTDKIVESLAHRWGRAFPVNPISETHYIYDSNNRIGICGDMFQVDGTTPFRSSQLSGLQLASAVAGSTGSSKM